MGLLRSMNRLPRTAKGKRSTISEPLMREFLRNGSKYAKVLHENLQKEPKLLYQHLKAYLKTKPGLPVKVVMRNKEVYLVRTDINEGEVKPLSDPEIDLLLTKK